MIRLSSPLLWGALSIATLLVALPSYYFVLSAAPSDGPQFTGLKTVSSANKMYRIRYGKGLRVDTAPLNDFLSESPGKVTFNAMAALPDDIKSLYVIELNAAPFLDDDVIMVLTTLNAASHTHQYYWVSSVNGVWKRGKIGLEPPDSINPFVPVAVQVGGDTLEVLWTAKLVGKDGRAVGTQPLLYRHNCTSADFSTGRDAGTFQWVKNGKFQELADNDIREFVNNIVAAKSK